jgi:CelD/BcsL family acetyltransferase involved in cellulose biosynthesis
VTTTGRAADTTYRLEIADTVDDVERLRPLWERLEVTNVDADLDYFLTVVGADPSVLSPYVLTITRPGSSPVLVVARLADERFGIRAGYRSLRGPRARCLVVSFDGILGVSTPADRAAVMDALRTVLDSRVADAVLMRKFDTAGWLPEYAAAMRPRLLRMLQPEVMLRSTTLPDSWEGLLAQRSAKSRRQIRYDDNKVRRRLAGRLTLRRLDRPEEVGRLADVQDVAARSYQAGIGASVADHPVQQAMFKVAADHGWLRVWMAYVDDEPAAFWWGIVRQGVLLIGSPGFDPRFAEYRLGYYTLRRMLEDSCADPEIDEIDYGPGDADYKERFGTQTRTARDVLLFARRPRSILLACLLRAHDRGVATAKAVVERSGRTAELKRRARARLVPARPENDDL